MPHPGPKSPLEDATARQDFAQLYADGKSRQEIADFFMVRVETISRWLRRNDVQALISEIRHQRINRVTRKIDAVIEARLEHPEKMETELLLKIRKELTPTRVEVGRQGAFDTERAAVEAWQALDAGDTLALEEGEVVDADAVEE